MTKNRFDGFRDIVEYYTGLVRAGRWEYIDKLIRAQGQLGEHLETEEEKEKGSAMEKIKQIIQARIKHNGARLLWKEDIDFTNMSRAARSFSAGQASTWVSEIYFLKGVLEEIDRGNSELLK